MNGKVPRLNLGNQPPEELGTPSAWRIDRVEALYKSGVYGLELVFAWNSLPPRRCEILEVINVHHKVGCFEGVPVKVQEGFSKADGRISDQKGTPKEILNSSRIPGCVVTHQLFLYRDSAGNVYVVPDSGYKCRKRIERVGGSWKVITKVSGAPVTVQHAAFGELRADQGVGKAWVEDHLSFDRASDLQPNCICQTELIKFWDWDAPAAAGAPPPGRSTD